MVELIGLLIFLSASAILGPNLIRLQEHSLQQMRDGATAAQLVEIAQAANQFIQTNYPTLVAAGGTQTISVAELQSAGVLSPSVIPTNPYEQMWEVQVDQPTAGDLQGVVLSTGGVQMTQTEQGDAAAQTNGIGGFVPFAANGSTATATGAFGGWQIPLTSFTNPGSGHMVGLLSFDNGQLINNDYLARVTIGGQPQASTMQTTLDAGGNNVTNANNVNANNQVTAGNGVASVNNDVGQGGFVQLNGSNGNAAALLNENGTLVALVNNNSALGFAISPGAQVSLTQPLALPADFEPGQGCTSGTIAAEAGTGTMLSCTNGIWGTPGGFSQTFQMGASNGEVFANTSGGPEFVSTFCQTTPVSSGFQEQVLFDIFSPSGLVSQSQGVVEEGGADADTQQAPSTSAIIPAGDQFSVSGEHFNCSLMITE
jgi:hypothetical protein